MFPIAAVEPDEEEKTTNTLASDLDSLSLVTETTKMDREEDMLGEVLAGSNGNYERDNGSDEELERNIG